MSVCNFCKFFYDNLSRIPLLIIPCGHTFCSNCLKDIKTCPNVTCHLAVQYLHKNNDLIPRDEIIFHNRYEKRGLIGSGQFGVVHRVFDIQSKKEFALKEIDRHRWLREKWTTEELQILRQIDYRYIISFHDAFDEGTHLYILTEFCKGGDLNKKIKEKKLSNESFNNETIFVWIKQMINGLHYLHSLKIMHRDLKPANVFLTEHNQIKLGDFGIARKINTRSTVHIKTQAGTDDYMSPEIKRGAEYSFNTDIWSLGCILYELITLKNFSPFFEALTTENKLKNYLSSFHASDILNKMTILMLVYDSKLRCESYKLYEMINSNFQEIRTLNGHRQGVKCLTVLKNGNLASCATDKKIKLWNPHTGELIKTLTGHTDYVWSLAVLENGLLVSGSWDKSIILWNINNSLPVKTLIGHEGCVRCLADLKNDTFASGSIDSTIKIWNTTNDEAIKTINAHSDYVECLVVLHNRMLASCSHDTTIKIWDPKTGLLVHTLLGHEHFVNSLFVLSDCLIASCSNDETIKIWNSSNGSLNKTIPIKGADINCLTLILNDILVVGLSKTILIWSLSREMIKKKITLNELDEIECLVHLENDMFCVGLSNGLIKIWA